MLGIQVSDEDSCWTGIGDEDSRPMANLADLATGGDLLGVVPRWTGTIDGAVSLEVDGADCLDVDGADCLDVDGADSLEVEALVALCTGAKPLVGLH